MGIEYSTAKWIAPASFLYDFAIQQYALNSSPNMQDINDRNISFWSPQPYFIGGFFFPQQIVQLAWLYRLWKLDPSKPKEKSELDQIVNFVPYYVLGNICIGTVSFTSHLVVQCNANSKPSGPLRGTAKTSSSPTFSSSSTPSPNFTSSSPSLVP
jgi:hypothetical protein